MENLKNKRRVVKGLFVAEAASFILALVNFVLYGYFGIYKRIESLVAVSVLFWLGLTIAFIVIFIWQKKRGMPYEDKKYYIIGFLLHITAFALYVIINLPSV